MVCLMKEIKGVLYIHKEIIVDHTSVQVLSLFILLFVYLFFFLMKVYVIGVFVYAYFFRGVCVCIMFE